MSSAAAAAGKAINVAFTAVAIIGVISMLYQAGKALKEFFFPMSDEMKRQLSVIDSLSDKYKTLAEEMENAALARKLYVSGGMIASSKGRQVSAANINELITNLQLLQTVEEKSDPDRYKEIKNNIDRVLASLETIDIRFKKLRPILNGSTADFSEVSKEVRRVATEIQKAGADFDALPNAIKDTTNSIRAFTKSGIQGNPLGDFVRTQKIQLTLLESSWESTLTSIFDFEENLVPGAEEAVTNLEKQLTNLQKAQKHIFETMNFP